jgi:hypothetical protein
MVMPETQSAPPARLRRSTPVTLEFKWYGKKVQLRPCFEDHLEAA